MDEIYPLFQVASRHAKLHLLGGIAQSHTSLAELVVDHQLPHAPGIHESYLGKVDERWPSRGYTFSQDVLEDLLVSNVEIPGELDQYGLFPTPVAPCCFGYRRVVYGATPSVLIRAASLCLAALRSSRRGTTSASGFRANPLG
jgi:hypothetical protein